MAGGRAQTRKGGIGSERSSSLLLKSDDASGMVDTLDERERTERGSMRRARERDCTGCRLLRRESGAVRRGVANGKTEANKSRMATASKPLSYDFICNSIAAVPSL